MNSTRALSDSCSLRRWSATPMGRIRSGPTPAIAEAVRTYSGSINTITTDNLTSQFTEAAVDELERSVTALQAAPKAPGPASGARRPTRQGAGGVLSTDIVAKALLGFAAFVNHCSTVEAIVQGDRAVTVYGSVGPGAPQIPA